MTDEADDDARAAEQRTTESADGADPDADPRGNGQEPATPGDEADTTEESDADPTGKAGEEAESQAEDSAEEPEGSLLERVAAHDEALAAAVSEELEAKEAEIEELEGKLTRKQADFQNFKKRQQEKLSDQVARATEDLVERLLPVRDNLARALDQDADANIREGVEGTLRELDRVLEDEGVTSIEPERGDEPDPERHEVMMRVESDQPAGTVEELYRPGYEMADRVIRPAQVTVSDGE